MFGGTAATCLWTANNCGPNDEIYSFHNGGANCLFGDGSVKFIREDIDPVQLRYLLTPTEGLKVSAKTGRATIGLEVPVRSEIPESLAVTR